MRGAVTVTMTASAEQIWEVITDIRNIGRYSPETFEAEWLDGATGPTLGAKFRGHVRRNEIGPVYWTTCRVTACEPGREFGVRGPCRRSGGEQLALPVDTRAGTHRRHRVVPAQRESADVAVLGVRRPAPAAPQPA